MAKTLTSRVDKLLSSMGYGSRREVAQLAMAGGITLDAAELTDVTKRIPVTADLPSRMKIDGEALDPIAGMVILLNKPLGMTCSHKEIGKLVYDILPARWRRRDPAISTIGRLDKQTSGLLLLTDDGDLNRFVNVYLNDEDVRFLDGINSPVSDGDNVTILPAVAGGQ